MSTINVLDAAGSAVAIEKPLAPGRAMAAASRPVALSTEDNAQIGALAETAPASDTASSGLNGRLQRIAQRLTSLIALLPASLGVKTAANSLSVAPASDAEYPIRTAALAAAVSTTIASGTAITGAIDLAAERLHRIVMPSGWTAAAISFQASYDGASYADLYDKSGEVTLSSSTVAASRSICVPPEIFYGVRWLKIRSGTGAAAVNQAADRTLQLATVPR